MYPPSSPPDPFCPPFSPSPPSHITFSLVPFPYPSSLFSALPYRFPSPPFRYHSSLLCPPITLPFSALLHQPSPITFHLHPPLPYPTSPYRSSLLRPPLSLFLSTLLLTLPFSNLPPITLPSHTLTGFRHGVRGGGNCCNGTNH